MLFRFQEFYCSVFLIREIYTQRGRGVKASQVIGNSGSCAKFLNIEFFGTVVKDHEHRKK
jgi:hypothetical protein